MTARKLTRLGPKGALITPSTPKKSWAGIVKTNIKVKDVPKVIPVKPLTGAKPIEINIQLKIPISHLDKAYPDILISMMPYMDEKTYLAFTSANEKLEDLALINPTFLEYLKRYRPKELNEVMEQIETYRTKVKGFEKGYDYYDIHYDIYPEHYLTEEEIEEFKEEQRYSREEDVLEYGRSLDE